MNKQGFSFLAVAALLVVAGSSAKADDYSVVSVWTIGSPGHQDTITGNGTFDWNGTTFSNISFAFTLTSQGSECGVYSYELPCYTPLPHVLWSDTHQNLQFESVQDGPSNTFVMNLVFGDGTSDCNGTPPTGGSCADFIMTQSQLPTSAGLSFSPTGGSTQTPNTTFKSATITDLPEPSAVALLGAVSGILGFVIFRRRKLVQ
jgi:hypothetical protein